MNEQQRSAFIIARAAMLNAEIAGMQAENLSRANRGLSPAYDEALFQGMISNYSDLYHNNLLTYLRGE